MTTAAPPRPYKGLAPFEDSEQDAALFFGRERERDVITANLLASRLTVLYGASGVGKSSLLRAGVAHELGKSEEVVVASSWSEDPLAVLDNAAALAAERGELFLILDQLEEFFLYHGDNGAGTAFAARLAELVQRPDIHVSVLLGIREESLARLDAFKGRLPNVLGNYLRLEHLDRRKARAAIIGPLRRYEQLGGARIVIEAALVEAVLDEVSAVQIADGAAPPGRIETPYLQLVMDRIWEVEHAAGSSVLRLETLRELGGAERIVREHLDRALAALTPAQQATAALMFDHLVTPSGAKIAHAVPDLVSYAGVSAAAAYGVIARLEGERILRPVEGGKVEIFHDVLGASVSAWRRDYEASLELGRARRRSRRLAALAAGSLVALAFVSVVALYALSQRQKAQEQAAVAQAAVVRAENETQRAEASEAKETAAKKEAVREKKKAQASAAEAKDARDDAVASANYADQQRETAEQQTDLAQQNATIAQQNEAAAVDAQKDAEHARKQAAASADDATHSASEARRQATKAQRQRDLARARALVAKSAAELNVDTEQSIRDALRASQLEARAPAEDALRDALASFRLEQVFLGAGAPPRHRASLGTKRPKVIAVFSHSRPGHDSLYVATAAAGGEVRLFYVESGRRKLAFKPAADVTTMSFSPDDSMLVAGTGDGRALVWSVRTGALLKTLPHPDEVTATDFTSDGQLVVTGGADGVVRVWEPSLGLQLTSVSLDGAVRSLSLQPGGRLAVAVTERGSARVLNVEKSAVVADLDRGEITAASFSPGGDVVVAGGDPNAFVWDARNWKLRATLEGHASTITDVEFTPDNLHVMTTSADTTARLWDLATGAPPSVFTGWHTEAVVRGGVSPRNGGDSFLTASSDGTVGIWGLSFTEPTVLAVHGGAVTDAHFSQDGWHVLTASADGSARLWRARDPNFKVLYQQKDANERDERSARAAFSSRGERLVTVTATGTGRLYDGQGAVLKLLPQLGGVRDIAISGSGWFTTAGEDGKARLFRPDGTQRTTLEHGSRIDVVAMTQDGELIATGGLDGRVVVFGRSGNVVRELLQGAAVKSIEFRSPGMLATGGADGSVKLWSLRAGVADRSLAPHQKPVTDLAFSRRGLLATASEDKSIHVYELGTGKPPRVLQGHPGAVNIVEFSPNGDRLVSASVDGEVRGWSTKTWQPRVFRGRRPPEIGGVHTGLVSEVRFSSDGRWVLTAGPSAAGVWDARRGDLLYFVRGHRIPVLSVTFSADGKRVLTAGRDGTMRAWDCRLCGELRELQKLARGRLHLAERGR